MKIRRKFSYFHAAILTLLFLFWGGRLLAQTATASIHGQVLDPSGASVANATILLTGADGQSKGGTADKSGNFEVKDIPPGTYTVKVFATGFAVLEKDGVILAAGQSLKFSATMAIETQQQQITVSADAPTVDVNPQNNTNSLTIANQDLDALPDDPDELQTDLQALAGPSPGPNGGQMYIDGFTAGNCRRNPRSEKFESTKIHFLRNTTEWAMAGSRFSRNREQRNGTDNFPSMEMIRLLTERTHSCVRMRDARQNPDTIQCNTAET